MSLAIQSQWNAGGTKKDIAHHVGCSLNAVISELRRLRLNGKDIRDGKPGKKGGNAVKIVAALAEGKIAKVIAYEIGMSSHGVLRSIRRMRDSGFEPYPPTHRRYRAPI